MLIVFDADEKYVYLAAADPLNETAIHAVEEQAKKRPQVFISTATEVNNLLDLAFSTQHAKTKESS